MRILTFVLGSFWIISCSSGVRTIKHTIPHEPTIESETRVRVGKIKLKDRGGLPTVPTELRIPEGGLVDADGLQAYDVLELEVSEDGVQITTPRAEATWHLPAPGEVLVIRSDSSQSLYSTIVGDPEDEVVRVPIPDNVPAKRSFMASMADTVKWAVIGLVVLVIAVGGYIVFSQLRTRLMLKSAASTAVKILADKKNEG